VHATLQALFVSDPQLDRESGCPQVREPL